MLVETKGITEVQKYLEVLGWLLVLSFFNSNDGFFSQLNYL